MTLTGVVFLAVGCGNSGDTTAKQTTKTPGTNSTTGNNNTTGSKITIGTTTAAKATNSFTTALTCANIEFGGTLAPNAVAAYGTVTYKYSSASNGTFSETAPTAIGTYYVKAYVAEDDTYKALESSAISFDINEIIKSTNRFTTALTCSNIESGGTLAPNAVAAHGTVIYKYATSAVSFTISADTRLNNSFTTNLSCPNIYIGGTVSPNGETVYSTTNGVYDFTWQNLSYVSSENAIDDKAYFVINYTDMYYEEIRSEEILREINSTEIRLGDGYYAYQKTESGWVLSEAPIFTQIGSTYCFELAIAASNTATEDDLTYVIVNVNGFASSGYGEK